MREGRYEEKERPGLAGYSLHRIIIPVFVPHLDGYFTRALEVIDLSLRSLRATLDRPAAVTVVANGCAPEVVDLLAERHEQGWIDQMVVNRVNRGKVDAIVGLARGSFEPIVTFCDGDVLFTPGWLGATEAVFRAFPECGAVAPSPNPAHAWSHTAATMWGALLRRELRRERVVPEEDLRRFAASIGNPDFFRPDHYARQWIVRRGETMACVGAGHFALALRREAIATIPAAPSLKAVTGSSEVLWLDAPPDRAGMWRLSTRRAFVHHIGNVPEPWMIDTVADLERTSASLGGDAPPLPPMQRSLPSHLPRRARNLGARWLRRAFERTERS